MTHKPPTPTPEAEKIARELAPTPRCDEFVRQTGMYPNLVNGDKQRKKAYLLLARTLEREMAALVAERDKAVKCGLQHSVKREWVKCPVCCEPDMRWEEDKDGNAVIFCVNHACLSNGGKNASGLYVNLNDAWKTAEKACKMRDHSEGLLLTAQTALTAAREREEKFVRWIVDHCDNWDGDWACTECRPGEKNVIPGFRCAVHTARALLTPPNDGT